MKKVSKELLKILKILVELVVGFFVVLWIMVASVFKK